MDALIKTENDDEADTPKVTRFQNMDQQRQIETRDAQQGFIDNAVDNFAPAGSAVYRQMRDEAPAVAAAVEDYVDTSLKDTFLEGTHTAQRLKELTSTAAPLLSVFYEPEDPTYNKEEHREALLKDLPLTTHDDVMEHRNFNNAMLERNRILATMARGKRNAQQEGIAGPLAIMAGSVVDVDLPLAALSGGSFGAAKVARTMMVGAKAVGMSPNAAVRASSFATGINAGLQAGVVTGLVEKGANPLFTVEDIANSALAGMALGGTLNAVVKGDVDVAVAAAREELVANVKSGKMQEAEPDIENAVPEAVDIPVEAPSGPRPRPRPRVFDADGNAVEVKPKTAEEQYAVTTAARDKASAYTESPEFKERVAELKKEFGTDDSVGASRVPGTNPAKVLPEDPLGNRSPQITGIIEAARDSLDEGNYREIKARDDAEFWGRVANHKAANLSTNDFRDLHVSKSNVANWLAHNVFESANGMSRGRFTAATGMEMYHNKIMTPIGRTYGSAAREWAKANKKTWHGTGVGMTTEGKKTFNREVMLERNARSFGRKHTNDPHVNRAADGFDEAAENALGILQGRDGQKAVDGFEGAAGTKPHYTPYRWSGTKLLELERAGTVTRQGIVQSIATGYQRAGISDKADAAVIAQAVVDRALAKDNDVDTNLLALLSGDGRLFLQDSLKRHGMADSEIRELVDRLTGKVEDAKREGFAKARNDIDLDQSIPTADGSDVKIVDLMDNDVRGVWQNYARRASGSAALARVGITNRAQRDQFITAMQSEQRALGEEVTSSEKLHAMLSHFNGGPVQGFSEASGVTNGVGAELAIAKRITGLALLGKLGFAQLAETGNQIAMQGMKNWWTRGPMARFDADIRAGNQELLDDMSYIVGDLGREHVHFDPHLDLDDVSRADRTSWIQSVSKLTSQGQFIQNYTSLFNHVRSFQQRTAALGMADKVMRTLDDLKEVSDLFDIDGTVLKNHSDLGSAELNKAVWTVRRFQSDLGLEPQDLRNLVNLIEDGTVEFKVINGRKYVNRLNMDKWEPEMADVFASALTRNTNQIVQKSMAGEADAWMHTSWGSVLTHLKSFPLQAFQKQFIRNMRHSDPQTVSTVMMGFATAMTAMTVRDAIEGKDRDFDERVKVAFGYSNMTSWVPMAVDPTMTLLGLEDYRINAFGPHSTYTPAIVTQMNRMGRLPGSIVKEVAGEGDGHTRDSLRALPFMNTLGLARVL